MYFFCCVMWSEFYVGYYFWNCVDLCMEVNEESRVNYVFCMEIEFVFFVFIKYQCVVGVEYDVIECGSIIFGVVMGFYLVQ